MSDIQNLIGNFIQDQSAYRVVIGWGQHKLTSLDPCTNMAQLGQRINAAHCVTQSSLISRPSYDDGCITFATVAKTSHAALTPQDKMLWAAVILRYKQQDYLVTDTVFKQPCKRLPNAAPLVRIKLNIGNNK